MELVVNGKSRTVEDGLSVTDLLASLEMRPEMVHVQVNGDVIARERMAEVTLQGGDEVEIVMSMGGGK